MNAPSSLRTYAAGIVNHRSYGDLRACLASLQRQTHAPLAVTVIDHGGDPVALGRLAREHPWVRWASRPNRGYAAGANAVLAWIGAEHADSEYALLLNPDVVLTPGFAEILTGELARAPRAGLASGKLLRPDGLTLDSAGIRMPRNRRPRDRGADEPDRGQYDRRERVFAVTGAAMLLRRAALPDLEVAGEIFDEDFFAYHEDTDLAWRARLMGWQALYVPEARALHRRGWRADARFTVAPAVRRHSFKNHYLELLKNERIGPFVRDLPAIAAWEVLRLGFSVLRDRSVLGGYVDALRLAPRAWSKRRIIQRRAADRRAAAASSARSPQSSP